VTRDISRQAVANQTAAAAALNHQVSASEHGSSLSALAAVASP